MGWNERTFSYLFFSFFFHSYDLANLDIRKQAVSKGPGDMRVFRIEIELVSRNWFAISSIRPAAWARVSSSHSCSLQLPWVCHSYILRQHTWIKHSWKFTYQQCSHEVTVRPSVAAASCHKAGYISETGDQFMVKRSKNWGLLEWIGLWYYLVLMHHDGVHGTAFQRPRVFLILELQLTTSFATSDAFSNAPTHGLP